MGWAMLGVGLLGTVLVGLIAGWLAEQVLNRNHGLFANLVVGLIGAVIGGAVANALEIRFVGLLGGLIMATLGSLFLLAILVIVRPRLKTRR